MKDNLYTRMPMPTLTPMVMPRWRCLNFQMTYINIQFNNVRVNRWLIYIKQNLGNSPEINSHLEYNVLGFFFNDFFFYQGFLSRTLTTHRTAGEGGTIFIPLYHFHPLTNIQAFICNFACEMTITYF